MYFIVYNVLWVILCCFVSSLSAKKRVEPPVLSDSNNCQKDILDRTGFNLQSIHRSNIYEDFKNGKKGPSQRTIEHNVAGWGLQKSFFDHILHQNNATFIVEVGSWQGLSAIHMGKTMKQYSNCGVILCVDTWLGTPMAWMDFNEHGNELHNNAGYPSVYYNFLYNVKSEGLSDTIIPLPMPSQQGAIFLKHISKIKNKLPDLIFIDACHDRECTYNDILTWYPLVSKGGILFGDDWNIPGTRGGVQAAADFLGIGDKIVPMKRYWMLHK